VIAELDRYHGIVLRQILIAHGRPLRIGVLEESGRVDVFSVEGAAFLVKHSSKRLSPWQFTYSSEGLIQLNDLRRTFASVWAFLVCGQDGVVGLSLDELNSIVRAADGRAAWVRVSRGRRSMYRVAGTQGELPRAKSRGVHAFVSEAFPPNVALPPAQ
jgi:hypothetical protein